jgi:hypothetical protein
LLEKTRKPFKTWFRAIFDISARRNGISAKDLQRIMGFGSLKTAWAWLHKLRAAMVRFDSEPLGPFVQMDEALVGGKGTACTGNSFWWRPRPSCWRSADYVPDARPTRLSPSINHTGSSTGLPKLPDRRQPRCMFPLWTLHGRSNRESRSRHPE